jgi:hypothetical protein
MESNSPTSGAVEMTSAHARVWRERRQPGTRLLADHVTALQGTTLSISGKSGVVGQVAVQGAGAVPAFVSSSIARTYMDVPPFRTGRPPV